MVVHHVTQSPGGALPARTHVESRSYGEQRGAAVPRHRRNAPNSNGAACIMARPESGRMACAQR
jgi:hypothetical protein